MCATISSLALHILHIANSLECSIFDFLKLVPEPWSWAAIIRLSVWRFRLPLLSHCQLLWAAKFIVSHKVWETLTCCRPCITFVCHPSLRLSFCFSPILCLFSSTCFLYNAVLLSWFHYLCFGYTQSYSVPHISLYQVYSSALHHFHLSVHRDDPHQLMGLLRHISASSFYGNPLNYLALHVADIDILYFKIVYISSC